MTDIRKFAVEETGVIHLRDGADELMYADEAKKKPITITVYGPGSKQFAAAQARQSNRAMELIRKKRNVNRSADDVKADDAEFLASCTKEFGNISYDKLEGEALFKAVYSDPTLGFITDQVNKYLGDWANFTKSAS